MATVSYSTTHELAEPFSVQLIAIQSTLALSITRLLGGMQFGI